MTAFPEEVRRRWRRLQKHLVQAVCEDEGHSNPSDGGGGIKENPGVPAPPTQQAAGVPMVGEVSAPGSVSGAGDLGAVMDTTWEGPVSPLSRL